MSPNTRKLRKFYCQWDYEYLCRSQIINIVNNVGVTGTHSGAASRERHCSRTIRPLSCCSHLCKKPVARLCVCCLLNATDVLVCMSCRPIYRSFSSHKFLTSEDLWYWDVGFDDGPHNEARGHSETDEESLWSEFLRENIRNDEIRAES